MRMTVARVLCVTAVLGLALAGCAGSNVEEFGRGDADTIREMVQRFSAAYKEKDAAAVTDLFSGAAVLMPPNSSTVRGPDSIRGFYEVRFAQGDGEFGVEVEEVGGHGTLAFATGSYSLTLQPPGEAESRDRGKVLWVARSNMGQWRFEYQIWSSDLPVQMPSDPEPAN